MEIKISNVYHHKCRTIDIHHSILHITLLLTCCSSFAFAQAPTCLLDILLRQYNVMLFSKIIIPTIDPAMYCVNCKQLSDYIEIEDLV